MKVIPYPAAKTLNADVLAADGGLCVGCFVKDGRILPALSPVRVGSCPAGVFFGAVIQPSGRIVVCNGEGIYYSPDGKSFIKSDSGVTASRPFVFHPDGGKACLAGDAEFLVTGVASSEKKPFNGNIFGGVFKNGRLFGIDADNGYIIRWSCEGGLDFTDKPDGAGWLEINAGKGKIQELAVCNQSIAVLCEYGLAALSAFGMPENFKLKYIDGVTGRIFQNTAAVAGGKSAFLTERGLLTFDGSGVEKCELPLLSDVRNPVCAAGFGNCYFLSAYSKRLAKKVVYVADIVKGTAYIADTEADAFALDDDVHCFSDGGHYVLKEGGAYTFESGEFDFGTKGEKYLKSIHLGNSDEVEVTVAGGGISRIFTGVKGYLRPHMRGRSFKITVRGTGKIAGIRAQAEVWNGV